MRFMINIIVSAVLYDQMQCVRPNIMFGFSKSIQSLPKKKRRKDQTFRRFDGMKSISTALYLAAAPDKVSGSGVLDEAGGTSIQKMDGVWLRVQTSGRAALPRAEMELTQAL